MNDQVSGTKRRSRWPLAAMLAVVAVLVAACGSGGHTAGASGTTTTPTSRADFKAYIDCMAQHGVKLPSNFGQNRFNNRQSGPPSTAPGGTEVTRPRTPPSLPAGVTQAAYDAARTACRDKLPTTGFGQGRGANSPAIQAYLSCLRDHGVQVPTTVAGQPGGGLGAIDRNSPAFQSANATCSVLLPNRSNGPTTTTPGG